MKFQYERCQFLMPNGVTITPSFEGSIIATISYRRITTGANVYVYLRVNARGHISIGHNEAKPPTVEGLTAVEPMIFTAEGEKKAFNAWRAISLLDEDFAAMGNPFAWEDFDGSWGLREHGSTVDTTSKIG